MQAAFLKLPWEDHASSFSVTSWNIYCKFRLVVCTRDDARDGFTSRAAHRHWPEGTSRSHHFGVSFYSLLQV